MLALSTVDIAAVTRGLAALGSLDQQALRDTLAAFHVRELDRNECLLQGGEIATLLGVVVSGLIREYFITPSGIERTKNFSIPGQWTGSLSDLLGGGPSRAFIVAEEKTRLALLRWDQLQALEVRHPAFGRIQRRSAERLLMVKAEREYELICLDAEARYEAFQKRYGALESRIAARHVASYLGITPVHLSRLRRRRTQEKRTASSHGQGSQRR